MQRWGNEMGFPGSNFFEGLARTKKNVTASAKESRKEKLW